MFNDIWSVFLIIIIFSEQVNQSIIQLDGINDSSSEEEEEEEEEEDEEQNDENDDAQGQEEVSWHSTLQSHNL